MNLFYRQVTSAKDNKKQGTATKTTYNNHPDQIFNSIFGENHNSYKNVSAQKEGNQINTNSAMSSSIPLYSDSSFHSDSFLMNQMSSFADNFLSARPKQQTSINDLYESNSGTVMCFRQKDYVVLACDTRHSSEFGLNSRKMKKCFNLQDNDFLFAGIGFHPDLNELYFRLKYEIELFANINERKIRLKELIHVLMNILYGKRESLIYYVFPVLVGLNSKNRPTIYSSDCVGNYEDVKCVCYGSGQKIIQPLLDSVINGYNNENKEQRPVIFEEKGDSSEEHEASDLPNQTESQTSQQEIFSQDSSELDLESAINLTKKAFYATAERDVKTGDYLQIFVYTKDGVQQQIIDLRKD